MTKKPIERKTLEELSIELLGRPWPKTEGDRILLTNYIMRCYGVPSGSDYSPNMLMKKESK